MRLRFLPALPALCAVFILVSRPAAADRPVKPDQGKFLVFAQDSLLGTDTFTITADGTADGNMEIDLGGQKLKGHDITRYSRGVLVSVATEAVGHGKFTLGVQISLGKITVDDKARPDQKLPGRLYGFGNFSPHLLTFAVAAYDTVKGGPQAMNLVDVEHIGPAGVRTIMATVTAQGAKPRTVGGRTVQVTSYAMVIAGPIGNIDTVIYTDIDGRVLLLDIPGQKLKEVREGYEDLTKPDTPLDSLLSKPDYTVHIDRNVKVAMRDGINLIADVYRPDKEGKFPVILQRTPYGRGNALEAGFYAKRGYVFVAQDVRGRFDSDGEFQPFVNEAGDGYDSVEWCAAQPWSSGSVGMIGGSYLGFVQWAAAREGSTHLKCLIPIVSPPDPFFNVPYAFGALLLSPSLWWSVVVLDKHSISIESPITQLKDLKPFYTLPLTGIDKAVLGKHVLFFQEWLRHSSDDAYWQKVDFNDKMKTMGPMPALHVSGWFDGDGIGTKRNYVDMVASGHANQKLIYGAWGHAVNTTTKIGGFDFGPQSLRDLDTLYLRWFDHWLKDVDNGINREPPVDAFIMGENKWHTFSAWPPKESINQKWYFHSRGHAGADKSDGTLSTTPPSAGEPPDHFTYDPAHPYIPGAVQKAAKSSESDTPVLSATDAIPTILQYDTRPLQSDVTVAGPISAHIVAATSARDTDWFAMLVDVYPDGTTAAYCQGIIRARFRNSFRKPILLKGGETAGYDIDLWALGSVFKKGHRIRVIVTSSCFPAYDRNLNTGGDLATGTRMVIAHQTIFHQGDRASYVRLPVLSR